MEEKLVSSPRWSSTTKLLVGLVIIGIIAFLMSRFGSLIPPLLMIFIIAYLFHPLTALIANGLGISWKAAVNILYVLVFILLIGLLTLGGIGVIQQVQSLINQLQTIVLLSKCRPGVYTQQQSRGESEGHQDAKNATKNHCRGILRGELVMSDGR